MDAGIDRQPTFPFPKCQHLELDDEARILPIYEATKEIIVEPNAKHSAVPLDYVRPMLKQLEPHVPAVVLCKAKINDNSFFFFTGFFIAPYILVTASINLATFLKHPPQIFFYDGVTNAEQRM